MSSLNSRLILLTTPQKLRSSHKITSYIFNRFFHNYTQVLYPVSVSGPVYFYVKVNHEKVIKIFSAVSLDDNPDPFCIVTSTDSPISRCNCVSYPDNPYYNRVVLQTFFYLVVDSARALEHNKFKICGAIYEVESSSANGILNILLKNVGIDHKPTNLLDCFSFVHNQDNQALPPYNIELRKNTRPATALEIFTTLKRFIELANNYN